MIDLSFQKFAYDKFRNLKVGALFMKMGSGKTKVAVDLANANADKVDRLIWICPNQVKDSTIKELKKWSPRMRFRVVAYESLSQSARIFAEQIAYCNDGKPFLVLDESIFVKNGASLRWQRCKEIRKRCEFCLILNGTPVVKDEMDLYWQMEMLDSRIIPYNAEDFRLLFFDKRIYHQSKRRDVVTYKFAKQNAEALAKMVAPYTFQVNVDYGISENDNIIAVEPTAETRIAYSKLKRQALENIGNADTFMGCLTKMAHVAAIDANRIAKTAELVNQGDPTIVYALFVAEAVKLKDELNTNWLIMGKTRAAERRRYLNLFEITGKHPLILTYGTGSYGLNLQFASNVVFNSYGWNYGQLEQAKARVLRIGQRNEVNFTFVESTLPIQKIIRRCIDKKTTLTEFVKEELIDKAEELL